MSVLNDLIEFRKTIKYQGPKNEALAFGLIFDALIELLGRKK